MTIILIGAIIAVSGGLITAIGTYLHNKNSSERSQRMEKGISESVVIGTKTNQEVDSLKILNSELNIKSNSLIDKAEKQELVIDNLRQENAELYLKLAEASKNIYDYVKGGVESPIIEISPSKKDNYLAVLLNSNEKPIYGILVEITDYDQLTTCKFIRDKKDIILDLHCFLKASQEFNKEELGVGELYLDESYFPSFKTKEFGRYQIRYKLRHNTYYQQLVFKKVNDVIYTSSRIISYENEQSRTIKIIKPKLNKWNVNFEKEFEIGIINKLKSL